MSDSGLPAESQTGGILQRPTVDNLLTVVIAMLATSLIALAVFWGYSWWASTRLESQSSPASRTIEGLRGSVQTDPGNAAIRVRLAEALATAGLKNEAVSQLQQAVKIDPKHTGAWLDLGTIALQQNQSKVATRYFQKVVDLTEGDQMADVNARREQALFGLAQVAVNDKRWTDALRFIKGAIRIRQDASDSYLILAEAYQGAGDTNKAIQNLKIALIFDPNFGQAHYQLGLIEKAEGNLQVAAIEFRKAADAAPAAAEPAAALNAMGPASKWVAAAVAKTSSKDLKGAKSDYEIALALDPHSVPTALAYASLLEQLGQKTNTLRAYRQILEEDQGNKVAQAAVLRLTAPKHRAKKRQ